MKISVGRSGRDLGDFELEDVRAGLLRGLFLSEDFGWYPGLNEWVPILIAIRDLDRLLGKRRPKAPVPKKIWRSDKATDRQLKMLRRAGIVITNGLTKGKACDLISKLPEPFKRFKGKEIEILRRHGLNLDLATLLECHVVLERQKSA